MLQLRRILPAEGWLTQRMARLRARAHFAKKGHIARIQELQQTISKLPPQAKRKVARELSARYKELKIDQRIERLDKVVTGHELRVRNLTRQAQAYLANHDYQKLTEVLEVAQKIQKRCPKLFKLIERTEAKLLATAKGAARQARKVSQV